MSNFQRRERSGRFAPEPLRVSDDVDLSAPESLHPVSEKYGVRVYNATHDLIRFGDKAARYVEKGWDHYANNEEGEDALCNTATLIGEAIGRMTDKATVAHLGRQFREDHPEIPWADLRGMRNFTAHKYDQLDLRIIWSTLRDKMPVATQRLREILDI